MGGSDGRTRGEWEGKKRVTGGGRKTLAKIDHHCQRKKKRDMSFTPGKKKSKPTNGTKFGGGKLGEGEGGWEKERKRSLRQRTQSKKRNSGSLVTTRVRQKKKKGIRGNEKGGKKKTRASRSRCAG